jgi:hypothetical protein
MVYFYSISERKPYDIETGALTDSARFFGEFFRALPAVLRGGRFFRPGADAADVFEAIP